MKIDFEGRPWQLEMDEVDVRQGEKIQAYTGLTILAWYKSVLEPEAPGWLKSMQCLYWLIREQNSEPVQLETANFAPLKLITAFNAAAGEGEPAEAEEDPTRPADGNAAEEPAPPSAVSLSG